MAPKKKSSTAHAAALVPLAIGLTMNALAPNPKDHAAKAASSSQPAACSQLGIDGSASKALLEVAIPPTHTCTTRMSHGFPLPDPTCTPGAVNPTITTEILQDPSFRTSCMREQASSRAEKNATYDFYGIPHPDHNSGQTQICELDHLISLELGGADTVDNIWPQCGPDGVALSERFFKRKDAVENFLAKQVRDNKMSLSDAQKGITSDWTQFLAESEGCDGAACE